MSRSYGPGNFWWTSTRFIVLYWTLQSGIKYLLVLPAIVFVSDMIIAYLGPHKESS